MAQSSEKQQTQNAPSAKEPVPNPSINFEDLKAKVPKAFQGYVDPIIAWAKNIEDRLVMHEQLFKQIETTLPDTIKAKMTESLTELAARQQAQAQNMPQRAIAGLGGVSLGEVLQVLGGAGGENPMNEKINALFGAWLDKSLTKLTAESPAEAFDRAFNEEYIKAKARAAAKILNEGT